MPVELPNAHDLLRGALDHIAALEAQLKAKSDALCESRTEIATAAVTYHRLELELEEKSRDMQAAHETLLATKALFDTAVKSCAGLSAQIHDLEGSSNEKTKTIESLRVEIDDLKATAAAAKEQSDNLASTIEKTEQKYRAEYAAKAAQLEIQINQKKTEFLEQHLRFAALQSELASKNSEIKLAQLEIERLQALSASAQEASSKASAAVTTAERALRGEFDRQRAVLEDQIAQKDRQIAESNARVAQLAAELNNRKQDLAAATQKLERAQASSAEAPEEISALRQLIAELEQKHRVELAERTAQFDEQLKERDAEIAERALLVSALETELHAAQKETARYSTEIETAEQARRTELDELRIHNENQLSRNTTEFNELSSKIAELEAVNKILQDHNDQFVEMAFAKARKYADEQIAAKDAIIARLENELRSERSLSRSGQILPEEQRHELMTRPPKVAAAASLNRATEDGGPFCSDIAA